MSGYEINLNALVNTADFIAKTAERIETKVDQKIEDVKEFVK